jgi:hypothetical protein
MSPMKPCKRFRADGSACTNRTDYTDGWCRSDDCPGFLRHDPAQAPLSQGSPHGTAKHILQTGGLSVGDVSVEDVAAIGITMSAIDSFQRHHGGGERDAEVQLRAMLEDFLLKSARSESSGGFLKLAREGYELVLAPARQTITGYSTVHRERTWEQVKAGVKSRFGKRNEREASGPAPDRGPTVELSGFSRAFNPVTVHLTARVRRSYARNAGLAQTSDEELDAAIRNACSEFGSGNVNQRLDRCFEIDVADQIWLVSPDCRCLYGVKPATVAVDPPEQATAPALSDIGAVQPDPSAHLHRGVKARSEGTEEFHTKPESEQAASAAHVSKQNKPKQKSDSWQERKKSRKARKEAAQARAAANMKLVSDASAAGKLPRAGEEVLARVRAAGKQPQSVNKPEPRKAQGVIGRQQRKNRANGGKAGVATGIDKQQRRLSTARQQAPEITKGRKAKLTGSVLVWNLISSLDAPIRRFVEKYRRKNFSDPSTYEDTSPVADLLAEHHWLLDRDGNWRTPEEVTLDDLDPSYPKNEVLARQLQMRPTVSREVADLLKIESDDVDLLRRQPERLKTFLAQARELERGAGADDGGDDDENQDEDDSYNETIDVADGIFEAFNRQGEAEVEAFVGDGAAANPARRQERSAAALASSKEAEPPRRDRFRILSRKVWEQRDPAVRAYLLQTYGGRCQICQTTFPRRDGQPFFEARYIVSRVARRWLDTPGNSLCLCPTCLAKTLHGSSKAVHILHELRELAEDAANLPDGETVSFELCGEPVSIRFAQRHLIDLGALLAAESVEPQ